MNATPVAYEPPTEAELAACDDYLSTECQGHYPSEFQPMGEDYYCDGTCLLVPMSNRPAGREVANEAGS